MSDTMRDVGGTCHVIAGGFFQGVLAKEFAMWIT